MFTIGLHCALVRHLVTYIDALYSALFVLVEVEA